MTAPLAKVAAINAVELAAHVTAEGRDVIHVISGSLGVDWNLDHAIAAITSADYIEWVDATDGHELAVAAANGCRYLFGVKRPVPVVDPNPADARLDDFTAWAGDTGDLYLRCPHYGRGCWWDMGQDNGTLGVLHAAARGHLAADHRRVLDVEPGGAR